MVGLQAPWAPVPRVHLRTAVKGLVARLVTPPTELDLDQGAVPAGTTGATGAGAATAAAALV